MYIAGGGVIEQVPQFPDRWFNSAFIIGPDGKVALRYHKWHIPASIGLGTSPHDMLDEYRKVFGDDIKTLFPVIDTEIGKLGTMTCHDGCTPEVSRALGFNGCEVICHPVALQEIEGVSNPWDFWRFTRRTRAHDNMAYLLGSNWGTVDYGYYPRAFCPGYSFIIDYTGMMMREAPYPQEQVIGGDDRHRGAARAPLALQSQHLGRPAHRGLPADLREADLSAEPVPARQAAAHAGRQDRRRESGAASVCTRADSSRRRRLQAIDQMAKLLGTRMEAAQKRGALRSVQP